MSDLLKQIEDLTTLNAMIIETAQEHADENVRLRGLFKELRAAWFKGGDLDKDHVSQEALRIFIEAERTCG